MTPQSIERRACSDPGCLGEHEQGERVAEAASLCRSRGVQLTVLRQQVLELLLENGRPMGAYELIDALKHKNARPIGPPTVYRALEFLVRQRLVTRIESRNAYLPCAHPERAHGCLFLICHRCGASAEFEDTRIERLLAEDAAALGYRATRRVIEVEGTCPSCVAAGSAGQCSGAMISV